MPGRATTDAMPAAVSRHYEILEEAIAAHGGVRPVEQGEGDSVVGAFSRASDAVAAAVTAQRLLGAERWPDGIQLAVRMAVHTGEAQMRDAGNYFGLAVIRCARLRSCGHGGQVLISDVTASLVADRLPDGAALLDLGLHRLKDLGRPEQVWQLLHDDVRGGVSAVALAGCVSPQPAGAAVAADRAAAGDRRRGGADRVRAARHPHGRGRRRQDPVGLGGRRRGCGGVSRRHLVRGARAGWRSGRRRSSHAQGDGCHGDARCRTGRGRGSGARRPRAGVGDPGQLRTPGGGVRGLRVHGAAAQPGGNRARDEPRTTRRHG